MAYLDCKHGDPKPPNGWKLLTTASHFGIKKGYFGIAYWHPEHQQVVIAHRGTDFKNVGALLTDVKGVLFNNYVNHMSSASTFANKVVAVLREIEQEKVTFELFFTGHSLGVVEPLSHLGCVEVQICLRAVNNGGSLRGLGWLLLCQGT